ncbi:siderophore-interacting protein [Gilvimarinus agarilyticus]|uniref:siderophore-interacting protein n=1 Tax=Gilvimarinus sp. 2_MG-2023 TaxID=3062666 RepID=UPI001C083D7E|nr:siderophore-interacting protein [Gilvimarinus sp. 2_MG-2023]MBU2887437.1 siderophore-interacting protein [Gilvimarinus agarilyticus]MDO6572096.1 siderophore-interacting protein [Gilvimarinus sp. 2_MG-2023]
MAKPPVFNLSVERVQQVSPHMRRVTLGGQALEAFPADQASAYVKLLFPQTGSSPLMRTYTVSAQRTGEIDIDFVLHDAPGPAAQWASTAQPGSRLSLAGPGPKKLINHNADWFLLAGDMTALPALHVNLAQLPAHAQGYAVIEVPCNDDIQPLTHPPGLEVHWLINPTPDPEGNPLLNKVATLPWLPGKVAVWAACEFNSMRALRQYFKHQREIEKTHLYLSSYWKLGDNEDGHKRAKQQANAN